MRASPRVPALLGAFLALLAALLLAACSRDDARSATAPSASAPAASAPAGSGGSAAPSAAGSSEAAAPAAGSAGATVVAKPQRLVSLSPSATEVVAALGATELLVGVDDYSEFPPQVKQLPKVGSFLTPNLEAIVALAPTLVIVDDVHGRAAGALHDAGVATVECPIHALPDVKAALRSVGGRIGKAAEADRVATAIDEALDRAAANRPARRPRVLAVIDREAGGLGNLVTAGPGSWIDELLAVVGGANVLHGAGVRYPKISLEEVMREKPDVILDLSYAARESVAPWRTVAVPAVAAGRVRALADAYLIAPSPRVAEALAALSQAIR